jgi:hypothetical protein
MENIYQIPAESCDEAEQRIFWTKVVNDQITSSLGAEKFCERYQVDFSKFHYWKYVKIRLNLSPNPNSNIKHPKNKRCNKDASKFISLQIANAPPDISSDTPSNDPRKEAAIHSQDKKIEIVFKNNHRMILPPAISETNLLLLIKTLGELQC